MRKSMKSVVKRYNIIKRDTDLTISFKWFREADTGFLNGSNGIKKEDSKGSKTGVERQRGYGGKHQHLWLRKYFLFEENWNLTRLVVLPFLVSGQKLSIGSLKRETREAYPLFLRLLKFSVVTERPGKVRPQGIIINNPYPYFKAEKMGDIYQTDLVGPRYLRGTKGVTRFYSFHTVDVAEHAVWTSQYTDKQSISLCKHLVETWRTMGIPKVSQMDNEMAATGGGRYPYSLSQVIRLHLLMGIHMVFIPQGEPGRNATVESFNDLWQERVLRRHTCPTLTVLKRTSEKFLRYYHYEKPHRGLTQKEDGTRFPGILRDLRWKSLIHMPKRFTLDEYKDSRGHLNLPLASGKVSFVRRVDSHGRIEVNGSSYFIRRKLEGQYVVATLFAHRKKLVIKQDNKVMKSFSFPLKDHPVPSLLSNAKKI